MPDQPLSFFALLRGKNGDEIRVLRTTQEVQNRLTQVFEHGPSKFVSDEIEQVQFSGAYRPDEQEVLFIKPFAIPDEIGEAIQSPTSFKDLELNKEVTPPIKAIFTGWETDGELHILFQLFSKNQFLTRNGISIILSNKTFTELSTPGVVISYDITAYHYGEGLLFKSYYQARQIFDLSDYYREATASDVKQFIEHDGVHVDNADVFRANADSWVRRKIAAIHDRKILNNVSADKISACAEDYGIDVKKIGMNGKTRIVMPEAKKELKTLLKLLDEDYFSGPMSDDKFVSNSKRIL